MVLFRRQLGDVLRGERMRQGMTLRELSSEARISLGYISEIERGQKEASSELLSSLCEALDVPLSAVLREVSDTVAVEEQRIAAESAVERVPAGDVVASTTDPIVGSAFGVAALACGTALAVQHYRARRR